MKKKTLYIIAFIAICSFCIVVGLHFLLLGPLSQQNKDLGMFGDFIGGTLNPTFALFSFLALLYMIGLQKEELETLKKEHVKQNFENTFFKLLDLFIKCRDDLITKEATLKSLYPEIRENTPSEPFGVFLRILRNHLKSNYDEFNNKHENYTGVYFGQVYQILRFIDNSTIDDKQRYVNIFRALFSQNELEFLLYYCLGTIGKRNFKGLVEQYSFFEDVILNVYIENKFSGYDRKACGNNEKLLQRYEEIREKEKVK